MLNEYERRQLAGIEARLRADSPELFERSGDRGSLRRAGRRLTRWWAVVGLALACAGQLWSSVPMAWLGVLVLSVLAAAWIVRDLRQGLDPKSWTRVVITPRLAAY